MCVSNTFYHVHANAICHLLIKRILIDIDIDLQKEPETDLLQRWLKKMPDCESRGDFHEYTRQPLTVALIHLSVTSCPPVQ